ncbi:HflK protein [Alkaliphilus metalliredigens QYMF]|uniref:Protein HflK n=1 Tax=Alkaliphilus metalliredigens (strain QYMF) TaxID=293826 RepID=A6TSS6_ALKMQ|nr:FtsH protease activity modulator HflK [Alkaliphilus metalliredigens]ABR49244.1 HflK protein [Alkaliphilus metalliredigens QYMF]
MVELNSNKLANIISGIVILSVVGIWFVLGFYTLGSGEEAVVTRFGEHDRTVTKAGINWRPLLIDNVYKVNVNELHRLEFGFRTRSEGSSSTNTEYSSVEKESLMLTGDGNLINVEAILQYRIIDSASYTFEVDNQSETVRIAGESAIRRTVANHNLDSVMTENRLLVEQEIREELQEIVNLYKLGMMVEDVRLQDVNPPDGEVGEAFHDVIRARDDKRSAINEAEGYRNEIIPVARGEAAQEINRALAYKEDRIARARGDASEFNQILERYQSGKEVTRTRMYLETLEEVLPGIDKYIMDGKDNTMVLPFSNILGNSQGEM